MVTLKKHTRPTLLHIFVYLILALLLVILLLNQLAIFQFVPNVYAQTTFSTVQLTSVHTCPLDQTTFVIAYHDETNDHISFQIYDTNGTQILSETDVDTTSGGGLAYTSVGVSAFNSTTFVIGWFDKAEADATFAVYNKAGTLLSGPTDADTDVGSFSRSVQVSCFNSTHFVIGWYDYTDKDATFAIYDSSSNLIAGPIDVDEDAGTSYAVSVSTFNSTHFVIGWFDGTEADITFSIYDSAGTLIAGPIDADTAPVPSAYTCSVSTLNSTHFVIGWWDTWGYDPAYYYSTFSVYDSSGTLKTGPINADTAIGMTSYSVKVSALNSTAFVISWYDTIDFDLSYATYLTDGTIIKDITDIESWATSANVQFRYQSPCSQETATGIKIYNDNWVIAYSNTTTQAIWKAFYPNGTAWDGTVPAPDTTPPTYSNIGTNTTVAGQPCLFHTKWTDETGLAPTGGGIYGTNNTGTNVEPSLQSSIGISYTLGYIYYNGYLYGCASLYGGIIAKIKADNYSDVTTVVAERDGTYAGALYDIIETNDYIWSIDNDGYLYKFNPSTLAIISYTRLFDGTGLGLCTDNVTIWAVGRYGNVANYTISSAVTNTKKIAGGLMDSIVESGEYLYIGDNTYNMFHKVFKANLTLVANATAATISDDLVQDDLYVYGGRESDDGGVYRLTKSDMTVYSNLPDGHGVSYGVFIVDGKLLSLDSTNNKIWIFDIPSLTLSRTVTLVNLDSSSGINELAQEDSNLHLTQWNTNTPIIKLQTSGVLTGWLNETWTAFSANPDWSNITKTLNPTVGVRVEWCIWANDTSNNWNNTGIQYLITTTVGYALNLTVMDWDLTDAIPNAYVYMKNDTNSYVKTSNSLGWASWTGVSGTVYINVSYYGFWVNGTFSISVTTDTTLNLKCNLYDANVKVTTNSAVLISANVTIYNSTSIEANKIRTALSNQTGIAWLVNLPNNTLTFTVYDGVGNVLANTTITMTVDEQNETISITQNYATIKLPTFYIFGYGILLFGNRKKRKEVKITNEDF